MKLREVRKAAAKHGYQMKTIRQNGMTPYVLLIPTGSSQDSQNVRFSRSFDKWQDVPEYLEGLDAENKRTRNNLTSLELLELVNAAYPDQAMASYYDAGTGEFTDGRGGDDLARFLVIELTETFDAEASREEQLGTARGKLATAWLELGALVTAIDKEMQS